MEQEIQQNSTDRTKVLFLVTKSVLGGAQRYVFDLATALPKDQYDTAVAFGGSGESGSEPGMLKEMLDSVGIRTIFIPELGRDMNMRADRASYRALRALFAKEKPNILHINSPKAGGLGALAARREKIPRILYTAHGWAFTESIPLLSRIIRFFLSYLTVLLCHTVICVSKSDYAAMSRMPLSRKKLLIIHNGIKPLPLLAKEAARNALFSKDIQKTHANDVWIVTVAEHTMNKNLFRAIDAVGLVNARSRGRNGKKQKIFYTIIGDGEQSEALAGYKEQRALRNAVALLGNIPDSRRYLLAFDAAILPSLKEGFPYAVLEAGAAGLPMAASETGGIPEIIDHNLSGLLIRNPHSTEEIAYAFSELLDPRARETYGEKLRSRVENDFSFERMRAETFALYEATPSRGLVQNQPAPAPGA